MLPSPNKDLLYTTFTEQEHQVRNEQFLVAFLEPRKGIFFNFFFHAAPYAGLSGLI